ncbi:cobaltochelatase subunit CobN [Aurantimonas endophytica]|uniref:Cobaltochelatase CobN n=1 Tax=Aurantimonas endophytica TaxID=1522175 RepID=A0A7W6MQM8_9HYPH|nr:cobaltochelatase subunit CobN [Aurantimonas endophytica]MBB4004142.1 cobaltochelatase CobN [Aurantimonas endophytica]MCO6404985.1 cobaltochelatase subunit CobN [Aurantimonas endophytica]
MHLLLAQQGTIDDGGEAIDLGQSPADIVVLSAADTEIAGLAFAARRLGAAAPSLRLANLLRLKHPMSVDVYVERTLRHAKLVVVRLLGGAAYWPYGLDALLANAQASGGQLVVLPGDDKPDPGLDRYSTVSPEIRDRLWAYLVEGGAANADNFLLSLRWLLDGGDAPAEAQPLLKAGVLELGGASGVGDWPISPLVGEVSGRTEGGRSPADLSSTKEVIERTEGDTPAKPASEAHPPLPAGFGDEPRVSSRPADPATRGEIEGGEGSGLASTAEPEVEDAEASDEPISPLVGEMSGRTEGGTPPASLHPSEQALESAGSGNLTAPTKVASEAHPPLPAGISPTRGEINGGPGGALASTAELEVEVAEASDKLISPLVGEMSGRTEGGESPKTADKPEKPLAAIVCYRALAQSGQTEPVEALARALAERGLGVLPVFISSLKDPVSVETVRALFARRAPSVVINLTGFAVSSPGGERVPTVLEEQGAVVLQAVLASGARETWAASPQGLSARDLAMNVALPEVDGRVLSRAIAFKSAGDWDALTETDIVAHRALPDRVAFVAELAARWARLRAKTPAERRVAILLANYPNRDGRLGNGVGLDTPAGMIEVLRAMADAGYAVAGIPANGDALIDHLMAGPTNAGTAARTIRETMSLGAYRLFFATLPQALQDAATARWGDPADDPFVVERPEGAAFALPLARFGETLVGIQPARGYNIDPKETYHSPDLVPPHNYLALYAFLRTEYGADAIVHMGKHGNLEWLPGKALALSAECWPEAVLGPLPHLYPFIVNDPGEGTQAKRRAAAVIIDHLTPPLTRAESYGPLKDLEALVDEYYQAAGSDPRRLELLKGRILDLVRDIGLDHDAGIGIDDGAAAALAKLDAYLCDLKEMQIRDGLHVFGLAPEGRLLTDLVVALARLPRGIAAADASLHRALAADVLSRATSERGGAPYPPLPAGISPTRGEIDDATDSSLAVSAEQIERAEASDKPISPLVGEMSGRTEGGTRPATLSRSEEPSKSAAHELATPAEQVPEAHPPLPTGISPTRGEIEASTGGTSALSAEQKNESGKPGDYLISPLVGEMSGRTEGGTPPANLSRTEQPTGRTEGGTPPAAPASPNTPFDPLDCDMAAPWAGPRPHLLQSLSPDPWRTNGDTVERLELLAASLVAGETTPDPAWTATTAVLAEIDARLRPAVTSSGPAEIAGLLAGLAGRFVAPGPSGAPTRGRPDVLPTGRNFYSVDTRAVPTEAAWDLGRRSAELLVTRHLQDNGDWPGSIGITAWGTSNMRTGGDDIAQAFALIGARPVWDRASRRVTGYEIITLAELGRPRVDVTLRISGFFRDAFPDQIALFDRAARAVGALDEPAEENPVAARMAEERAALVASGVPEAEAARRAGFRVFGSMPGAYGAGLQALIDEKGWTDKADLAESYLVWGSYAYGAGTEGEADRQGFEARLSTVEAVVQNQDNREHDLLDSDDYYQFEGGMTAAVEHVSGRRPVVYHNDHSRPERPVVRTLEEEIGRVVRARVVNPKWIAGVMRHGYKGAFEIAATVDYMFAFAATTGAVRDHHFEAAYRAFVIDERVRAFLMDHNPHAFRDLCDRLAEAIDRGLWKPRSNSVAATLQSAPS